mgnify:FL=1
MRFKKITELEDQKRDIDRELEKLRQEGRASTDHSLIQQLRPLIAVIDPRFSTLTFGKQGEYVRQWLIGGNVDHFFHGQQPTKKGVSISYGPEHQHGYQYGSSIDSMNSVSVE